MKQLQLLLFICFFTLSVRAQTDRLPAVTNTTTLGARLANQADTSTRDLYFTYGGGKSDRVPRYIQMLNQLAKYVPYIGATTDVDLGMHSLSGLAATFTNGTDNNFIGPYGANLYSGSYHATLDVSSGVSFTNGTQYSGLSHTSFHLNDGSGNSIYGTAVDGLQQSHYASAANDVLTVKDLPGGLIGGTIVNSFNTRTGSVTPQSGDYSIYYQPLENQRLSTTNNPTFNSLNTATTDTSTYVLNGVIVGNSIANGAGATNKVYSFATQVATKNQVRIANYSVSGTTLVLHFAGDSSAVDRLSRITPTYNGTYKFYLSEYGTNDGYNINGTLDTVAFRSAYYTLINQLVSTRGWPANKIVLFLPYNHNPNGVILNNLIANIAIVKGTSYIDMYNGMISAGGDALLIADMIHPNNVGHSVISGLINSYLSSILGVTQYNTSTLNQDIITPGRIYTGVGIYGGSSANGLELHGADNTNNSGKITAFEQFNANYGLNFRRNIISTNTSGSMTTPNYLSFGGQFTPNAIDGSNLQLILYDAGGSNKTGFGVSSIDGLALKSIAGTTPRITSVDPHFFKSNATIGSSITGATTTPNWIGTPSGQYVSVIGSSTTTVFRGYGGSGLGFSSVNGVFLIAAAGLQQQISLMNNTVITGTLNTTSNAIIGTALTGTQAAPSFLDLGSSFSTTAATGLKLKIYTGAGLTYSAGNSFDYVTAGSHTFYNGTTVMATLASGGVWTTVGLDNYTSDLSGSYTPRSKVDKGFITTNYAPLISPSFTNPILGAASATSMAITGPRVGNATLVAGTVAVSITGITTSSKAFVTRTVANNASLTTGLTAVCTTGTLTITADVAAGTINTADTSSYNYFVIN